MKFLMFLLLLLNLTAHAQKDTLDLEKGPAIMYDFKEFHVPVMHSTEEFEKLKHEKDSLDLEYARRQSQPTLFGIVEKDSLMIKVYLKGGTCVGFPSEYQFFFKLESWPEKTVRLGPGKLREHLTLVRLGDLNDTIRQLGGLLESIEIFPEKDTACTVIIEGRIMNESCSYQPLTVRCKTNYKVQNGKELGLLDNEIPDYQFLSNRFLTGDVITIEYDTLNLEMEIRDHEVLHSLSFRRRSNNEQVSWFHRTAKTGIFYRYYGTYSIGLHHSLLREDYKRSFYVLWRENQQIIVEGKIKNFKPIGRWKYYFPDGTLRAEGKYKQFKKQDNFSDQVGKWTYYHPNGKLVAKGKYVLSDDPSIKYTVLDNSWEFYDPQGNRVRKRDVVKLYEPKEIVMPLPDYLEEIQFLVFWGPDADVKI